MNLKRYYISLLALLVLACVLFVPPAHAFDIRNNDVTTIDKNTTVQGTLLAGGKSVTVDGIVNGDIFCAAERVAIHGTINGDVICAGQTVVVDGIVNGNIRLAGQTVVVSSAIERNATVFGQSLTLDKASSVKGDVVFAGQHADFAGSIGRGLLGAGQSTYLNGIVGQDVLIYSENVDLGATALISGKLTYTSRDALGQDPHAVAKGGIVHLLPKEETKAVSADKDVHTEDGRTWFAKLAGSLAFYLIVGLLMIWLMPTMLTKLADQMKAHPLLDLGIGLLTVVVVPVIIILTLVTIIGIPLGILLGIAYGVLLVVSRIFVAPIVGKKVLMLIHQEKSSNVAEIVVGITVLWVAFSLPIIGFFLSAFAVLWGLGGCVYLITHRNT